MTHPLINKKDSPHYDSVEEPSILRFERRFTVGELMAWAKITSAKYSDAGRANKGQVEADKRKLATYENYYDFLKDIVTRYPHLKDVSAVTAYDILGLKLEY